LFAGLKLFLIGAVMPSPGLLVTQAPQLSVAHLIVCQQRVPLPSFEDKQ
jgi:hypothetical protein